MAICGTVTYAVVDTGKSTLNSIFSFDPPTRKLAIYTLNPSDEGTYPLTLKVYQSLEPSHSQLIFFSVEIRTDCLSNILTITTASDA